MKNIFTSEKICLKEDIKYGIIVGAILSIIILLALGVPIKYWLWWIE